MDNCRVEIFNWDFREDIEIPRGRITKKTVIAFTSGQCHALALAINEKTKWPIVGVYGEDDDFKTGTPKHVFVQSPDGGVDIQGLGANCRWEDRGTIRRVGRKKVIGFHATDEYLSPNIAVAREYVSPVLKLIERQRRNPNLTGLLR